VKPAAIILAGGRSSRFGGDKLAARLDGVPVLEHALRAVALVADPVVVVVSPDAPSPSIPSDVRVEVVPARDLVAHQGPLAGLVGGLAALEAWANSTGEGAAPDVVLLVAGDMPSLVPGVLDLLARALDADPSLGASTLETDPPTLLPSAIRASLAGPMADTLLARDRRSLRGLLDTLPWSVVPSVAWRAIDPEGRTLRDIDTPGDLSGR
jgi:molybdopterin-guanine dinucleotide biosynthesis protein A